MRRKELQGLLDEKAERVLVLETRIESMQQQLDAYRQREQSIVDSLASAQQAAGKIVADAKLAAASLTTETENKAKAVLAEAETSANALLSNVKNERTALLGKAEETVDRCRAEARRLNALIEQCAAEALAAAEQFAAVCGELRVDTRPLVEGEAEPAPVAAPIAPNLREADGNPAVVMQNIYELENRAIPRKEEPAAAEQPAPTPAPVPAPTAEAAPAAEELPDFAPRPEDAILQEPAEAPASDEHFGEPYVPEADWQPDEEPEATPSVSELMPESGDDEVELSLDALLDEIIQSGQ